MLPVRGDGKGDNVLAHAAVLAKKFGARVRVIHCHPKTKDMMPYGVVIPRAVRQQIEDAAAQNVDVTREQLTREFRDLALKLGLKVGNFEEGVATARFIDHEGKQVDAVRHYGRLSDLICVPQPDPQMNLGINTLKTALFSSGRPVMMCPHQDLVVDQFADHIAIGWNGSIEASRAVAMSMPIIAAAASVVILSSEGREVAPAPEELQRFLELKGIKADIRRFAATSAVVGDQLLSETKNAGASLLVMGAYHDSYERETLFGGTSQVVVKNADIPVLMVH